MSHVVVIGAGIAGLTAAYAAVQSGHRVTVLEAAERAGGGIAPATFTFDTGSLTVDAGAEAFAARSVHLTRLLTELGLAEELVAPSPDGSWLYLPEIGAVPAPKLGMWGIPGDPEAPEVRQALGPDGAARAARELELSMAPWAARRNAGTPVTIGELVADRFGATVLERLVAPVVAGVHSADPYDVDLDKIAPGLLEKAIEHGSVAKAVAHLRAAAPPGAAVKTLRGGMRRLIAALVAHLSSRAELRYNTPVTGLDHATGTVHTATGAQLTADRVILAVNAPSAYDLLASDPAIAGTLKTRPEPSAGVGLVVLVLDEPALDANPRGTGMLVSPAVTDIRAKAATHVTAKWDWAREAAGAVAPHRHVIRLSYGRVTDPADGSAPGHATPDAQLLDLAVADAAQLFGLDATALPTRIVSARVVRWRDEMPLTTPENTARIQAVQTAAQATNWIQPTGAWFAGTGLAAITAHTSGL